MPGSHNSLPHIDCAMEYIYNSSSRMYLSAYRNEAHPSVIENSVQQKFIKCNCQGKAPENITSEAIFSPFSKAVLTKYSNIPVKRGNHYEYTPKSAVFACLCLVL